MRFSLPSVVYLLLCGCVSGSPTTPFPSLGGGGDSPPDAQHSLHVDPQQVTGQIAAALKADLTSEIHTALEAKGVEYHSEFGVGPTVVLCCMFLLWFADGYLGHRRALARIRQGEG